MTSLQTQMSGVVERLRVEAPCVRVESEWDAYRCQTLIAVSLAFVPPVVARAVLTLAVRLQRPKAVHLAVQLYSAPRPCAHLAVADSARVSGGVHDALEDVIAFAVSAQVQLNDLLRSGAVVRGFAGYDVTDYGLVALVATIEKGAT